MCRATPEPGKRGACGSAGILPAFSGSRLEAGAAQEARARESSRHAFAIEVLLKTRERLPDFLRLAEIRNGGWRQPFPTIWDPRPSTQLALERPPLVRVLPPSDQNHAGPRDRSETCRSHLPV